MLHRDFRGTLETDERFQFDCELESAATERNSFKHAFNLDKILLIKFYWPCPWSYYIHTCKYLESEYKVMLHNKQASLDFMKHDADKFCLIE